MASEVTQSRSTQSLKCVTKTSGSITYQTDLAPILGCSQTTTSHRTSRTAVLGVDYDEEGILSAQTSSQLRAALRREYAKGPSSSGDRGHRFHTVKRTAVLPKLSEVVVNGYSYDGYLAIIQDSGGFTDHWNHVFPNTSEVDAWGTKAINQTIPTAPAADLALSLSELAREGLPAIPGLLLGRDRTPSSSGGEFLNSEFGIKPMLSDLRSTLTAVKNSKRILEQFERDSGRQIRRRRRVVNDSQTVVQSNVWLKATPWTNTTGVTAFVQTHPGYPWYRENLSYWSGFCEISTTTKLIVEFSGAYTYLIPSGGMLGKLREYASKADALLGLEVDPETLWNLAPWSWLADWNGNIGTLISNLTAFSQDSLVLKYGYLMVTKVTTRTYTLPLVHTGDPNLVIKTVDGQRGPLSFTYETVEKKRVRARPYGFSLDAGSYSDRQWAILGALGLTKGPSSLPD